MIKNVCAVIVTYNRKELLKRALSALLGQTEAFRKIYIVDNASTDGTDKVVDLYCKENASLEYIKLPENKGGAGGFFQGIKNAYEDSENEWIVVLDDDAILPVNYNEKLNCFLKQNPGAECCTGNVMFCQDGQWKKTVNDTEEYSIESKFTFVSTAFKRSLVEKVGFPESDYFIWFDDTEYCERIRKVTDIYSMNHVLVEHLQAPQTMDSLCWKKYYGIRNVLCMRQKHSSKPEFVFFYWKEKIRLFISCIIKQLFLEHSLSRFVKKRRLVKDAFRDFRNKKMGINRKYTSARKILILTEALGGGVYWDIVHIANHMASKSKMCIGYTRTASLHEGFTKEFRNNVELVELNNSADRNLIGYFKYFIGMRRLIKEFNPDVVHFHSSVAGVLGRWSFLVHTYEMYYSPHGFAYLNKDSKLKTAVYWLIEKISALRKCTIVACGEKEFELAGKFKHNSLCVLNGVDIEKCRLISKENDTQPEIKKRFRVVSVGRNCNQKNPQLFLKIAQSMPDYQFIWIGGKLETDLDNVENIEYTDRETVLKILNNSDVFMLTSIFEGLSLSLLEAMALKVPCVISNSIGNADVLEDGISGFVCDGVEQYCHALKQIEQSKEIKQKLTKNAYHVVCEKYSANMMLKKIETIYTGC